MKRFFLLVVLLAGAGLAAADVTPTAALAPPWDKVQLKDGQALAGKIQGYDAFFLEIEGQTGHTFNLPWKEVAGVQPAAFVGDPALLKQYLTPDYVEVTSHVESKDPAAALHAALWPGIFIHGYGYHVAGDQDMFLSLAGAELFGALVAGFGAARALDTGLAGDDRSTPQVLVWAGAGVFVISWAWDLIGAPRAARAFDAQNGLSLAPLPQGGAMLGWNKRF